MRIERADGTVDYEGPLSLKGRGNGTWSETDKKPYALRLDEKSKLLGMHKQKRWCLLANYKDRTLLRNDAAFWLSRHTELPYTVSGRFVELVWNGKHMGNYYLCEQIRIDNHRVDIVNPKLDDPENGGMLIVIDDFLGYSSSDRYDKSPMVGFRSTGANNRYKLPYVLKDPEEDENGNLLTSSSATYKYLFNYVKEMEDAIYNADKIKSSMLFLHGTDDTNVPYNNSVQMYTALKLLGKDVAMVSIKGENHGIRKPNRRRLWHNVTMAWFARCLKDDPTWWEDLYPKRTL